MSNINFEEYELLGDPKYRSYVAAVDKALRNFENTSEWADLISTLGKLNKILVSHIKYPIIPRRIIISKRLAQCMHPALPSGVHLKALETYDLIFKCMGTNRLSQELFIYSAGLFPLFGNAAMNVKSALLTIYETHFVPLGTRLRPGLNGFLSGILAGLEEGSDYMERTFYLLIRVAEGVGQAEFFGCLWNCILENSSVRLSALSHLASCYNKKFSTEDQLYILGTDIEITVTALCQAMEDNSVMVQRAALDFTIMALPMHNTQLVHDDLVRIVSSAILVFLRRDMSLNRRLCSWLLGTELNLSLLSSEHPIIKKLNFTLSEKRSVLSGSSAYFSVFSQPLLIEGVRRCLKIAGCNILPDLRPYKLIMSLLDKEEIGFSVIDDIFLDLLRCLYYACHMSKSKTNPREKTCLGGSDNSQENSKISQEVIKTALLLFSSLDQSYPWKKLLTVLNYAVLKNSNTEQTTDNAYHSQITVFDDVTMSSSVCECQVNCIGCSYATIMEVFTLFHHLLDIFVLDNYHQLKASKISDVLVSVNTFLMDKINILMSEEILIGLLLCKRILRKLIPSVALSDEDVHPRRGSKSSVSTFSLIQIHENPLLKKSQLIHEIKFQESSSLNGIVQIGIEANENAFPKKIFSETLSNSSKTVYDNSNIKNSDGLADCGDHSDNPVEISKASDEEYESASETSVNCCITPVFSYIHNYVDFFRLYIKNRLITCTVNYEVFLSFLFTLQKNENDAITHLQELLRYCLCSKENCYKSKNDFCISKKFPYIVLQDISNCEKNVLKTACSMLIDISSVPITLGKPNFSPSVELPHWLIELLMCLYSNNLLPDILQVFVSTLIEIVILAQSNISIWRTFGSKGDKSDCFDSLNVTFQEGITSVSIIPLLLPLHVHALLCHSHVFQHVSQKLWNCLDDSLCSLHISSVEMILQLHSLTLSLQPFRFNQTMFCDMSIVEKEIMKTLVIPFNKLLDRSHNTVTWTHEGVTTKYDSTAIKRWITLWQVSRSLVSCTSLPGLHRCLFLMIERLHGQSGLERSFSHSWLAQALQSGDCSRIVDPVLVFLLQPSTYRISIQHVNVQSIRSSGSFCKDNFSSVHEDESHIHAISSVEGEVIYHSLKSNSNTNDKKETKLLQSKYILALTSLSRDSQSCITKDSSLSEFALPSSYEEPQINSVMSLMINPFAQHPWIDLEDIAELNKTMNATGITGLGKKLKEDIVSSKVSNRQYYDDDCEIYDSLSENDQNTINSPKEFVQELLNEIIDRIFVLSTKSGENVTSQDSYSISESKANIPAISAHPIYAHLLLYLQPIDAGQCIYGLSLIRNIIEAQPRLSLIALASMSISVLQSSSPLMTLLAKHRQSIFGEGVDGSRISEVISQFRSTMYLQVVITVCLYYLRSYYPRLSHLKLRIENFHDNQELHVAAADTLSEIFNHLPSVLHDSPRGFTPYIKDLLGKCKVQKCMLHSLVSAVFPLTTAEQPAFINGMFLYNFSKTDNCGVNYCTQETYLSSILNVIHALIILEHKLSMLTGDKVLSISNSEFKNCSYSNLRFVSGFPIVGQPMFLHTFILVLNQKQLRHIHGTWLHLFANCLPFMGSFLPENSIRIMFLLCSLLEEISVIYNCELELSSPYPPDYALILLSNLTSVVHYSLLDSGQLNLSLSTQATSTAVSPTTSGTQSTGQILYNLLHVFSPVGDVFDAPLDNSTLDPLMCTRKNLLPHLPRIVSALLSLWITTNEQMQQNIIIGSGKVARQHLAEILSPICHHYAAHLLAAVSVVWQGIMDKNEIISSNSGKLNLNRNYKDILFNINERQVALVELIASLRVLPLHSLVATVKQVLKAPPIIEGASQVLPLEVSLLQFFYAYVQQANPQQLYICWLSLLSTVKDSILTLSQLALLILLSIINEFVQKASPLQDKKEIKDLQETTGRLIEACSEIAGSCLEATNWLSRSLTVKPDTASDDPQKNFVSHSVAALGILAEILAPLLDVLYASEEKEKVIPLLTNVMRYVIPYLGKHTLGNMPAFLACSQLLSSLSGYQYTLRAWKKDVLDLLLDSQVFMMVPEALTYWHTIIDNLCAYDKTVFKEILGKISLSQGGSLSIFSTKESEYETRAALLKRLSFIIFCSEMDQYLKYMPDIQERLTEVTRLGEIVPGLVAQVLFCFRVLLLRISPRGITSLWPVIITELVQVFLMMEQELSTDTEQFSSHLKRLSTLDSRWVISSHNGLHATNHPAWLTLYLSACKLLDLMLALPTQHLPQFQMYRWAFVGMLPEDETESKREEFCGMWMKSCDFVPHVSRITKLMNEKNKYEQEDCNLLNQEYGYLLLKISSISTLMDLQPFFNTIVSPSFLSKSFLRSLDQTFPNFSSSYSEQDAISCIQDAVEKDFLESLPNLNKM